MRKEVSTTASFGIAVAGSSKDWIPRASAGRPLPGGTQALLLASLAAALNLATPPPIAALVVIRLVAAVTTAALRALGTLAHHARPLGSLRQLRIGHA